MIMDRLELGGKGCDVYVTSGILEKGIYRFNVHPKGVCVLGEAHMNVIARAVHPYTYEQAEEFMDMIRGQGVLAKYKSVLFVLTNPSSGVTTTDILESDEVYNPSNLGSGVSGVINFDGSDDYVQISGLTVPSDCKIKFKLWLDKVTGFTDDMGIFDLGTASGDGSHFITCNVKNNLLGFYARIASGVYTPVQYSMSGLSNQILECVITKTGAAGITSFTINGVAQTQVASNPYGGINSNSYIGQNGSGVFLKDITIWDVRMTDLSDTIQSQWNGQPNGNTNAAWADQVGSTTAVVNGNPSTRSVGNIVAAGAANTNLPETDQVTYDQINRDFTVNPIAVKHLKFITTSTAQLFNLLKIKNSEITGLQTNRDVQIANFVSATKSSIIQVVDITFEDPILLDRNTYFEYTLQGSEVVTLLFYYEQMSIADNFVPVDAFSIGNF